MILSIELRIKFCPIRIKIEDFSVLLSYSNSFIVFISK